MSKHAKLFQSLAKAKKKKTEGRDAQYKVHLGLDPSHKSSNYNMWTLSKKELGHVLKNWDSVKWDLAGYGKKSREKENFHSTTISRRTPSSPLARHLKESGDTHKRALYHGVGRDEPGLAALNKHGPAEAYDPYHPESHIRKLPKGKFDKIHSHYTLNVVDKDTGHDILTHIHKHLSNDGHAVISVRADKGLDKLDKNMAAGYGMGGAGATGIGAMAAPMMSDPMMMSKDGLKKSDKVETIKQVTRGFMHPTKDKTNMLPGGGADKPAERKHIRADTQTNQDYILEKGDDLEKDGPKDKKRMTLDMMRANLKRKKSIGGKSTEDKIKEAMDRQSGKGPKSGPSRGFEDKLRSRLGSGDEEPQMSARERFQQRVEEGEQRREEDQAATGQAARKTGLYRDKHGEDMLTHRHNANELINQGGSGSEPHRAPGSNSKSVYLGEKDGHHYFNVKPGSSYRTYDVKVRKEGRKAHLEMIPNPPDNWHVDNEDSARHYTGKPDRGEKSLYATVKKNPHYNKLMGRKIKDDGHNPAMHPKDFEVKARRSWARDGSMHLETRRKYGEGGKSERLQFTHHPEQNVVTHPYKKESADVRGVQTMFDNVVKPHLAKQGHSDVELVSDSQLEARKKGIKVEKSVDPKNPKDKRPVDAVFRYLHGTDNPDFQNKITEEPKAPTVSADKKSSARKLQGLLKKAKKWSPILSD